MPTKRARSGGARSRQRRRTTSGVEPSTSPRSSGRHTPSGDVRSDEVQALVRRHYEWVQAGWQGRRPTAEQFAGLGQMYVDDPRFARTYDRHGEGTAAFVRDAMAVFADRSL